MAFNTVIQQGRFTADGTDKTLALRADWDWMWVYNETVLYAAGGGNGAQFYFQRGMTDGRGVVYNKLAADDSLQPAQIAADSGFVYVDSSVDSQGANTALTGLTAASPPVVTSAGHGLVVDDVVRFNTLNNQSQINGMDFSVSAAGATFTVGNINLTNSTASTTGNWRQINYDPIYYPRRRFITWVRNANPAVVYLSVLHGFTVGQRVRLSFPGGNAVWRGYAALDGVSATITAINVARAGSEPNNANADNNVQLALDASAIAAWNTFGAANNQGYPASTLGAFTPAQMVPLGEDSAQVLTSAVAPLGDATDNQSLIGVRLVAGANSPAGANADVIYWAAGKSFSDLDEV
jgi:hypothetical protein